MLISSEVEDSSSFSSSPTNIIDRSDPPWDRMLGRTAGIFFRCGPPRKNPTASEVLSSKLSAVSALRTSSSLFKFRIRLGNSFSSENCGLYDSLEVVSKIWFYLTNTHISFDFSVLCSTVHPAQN
jgi:hypothetical protein